jgi:catechol 2,3-dioxygenase-like lactoylglutathione lyase family enzyme
VPLATYKDLCIDANDAEKSALFWADLLGLTPGKHHNGAWFLDDPDGQAVAWVNPVPEPKTAKNRLHIDVNAEGLEAALAAGATVVDDSQKWTVMLDPDGNEFCAMPAD